jgi:hypothetical protein
MFKRTISALAVAAVAYMGAAQAQENATLILRSGERISGLLSDHGGVGFTIRVNNEERQIPTNDVAVVDFSGQPMTNADWARVAAGQHLLWLRNGTTVAGEFYDIGGTRPLSITMKTAEGERVFSSTETSRIVLARTDAAVAAYNPLALNRPTAAATTGTAAAAVVVRGNQQWTRTGLTVRQGETLTFSATGEVQLGLDAVDVATPAGAKSGRLAPRSPIPNSLAGALIGRIGNGRPFGIGDQTSIPAPASGQLFLGINDDNLNDNTGEFRVEITRSGGPVRK